MKISKKFLVIFISFVILMCSITVTAFAADSNVTYSGNAGEFVFSPGSEYSLTDLFPNFKDVMPGDTITQRITVNNDADKNVKVKIYLRAKGPTDESYIPFLNQLNLTVEKSGDTPMFDASLDKTEGLTEWTCLGMLYSGGKVDLNTILEVPITLDDSFQEAYGEIEWEFAVEEFPVSPDDPQSPDTGEFSMMWLGIFILFIILIIVFLLYRTISFDRREKSV